MVSTEKLLSYPLSKTAAAECIWKLGGTLGRQIHLADLSTHASHDQKAATPRAGGYKNACISAPCISSAKCVG